MGPSTLAYTQATVASIATFLYGWDFGATAWGILQIEDEGERQRDSWCSWVADSSGLKGFVVAGTGSGAVIGILLATSFMNRFSRTNVLQIASVLYILGGSLQASSGYLFDYDTIALSALITGRLTYGAAIGVSALNVPKYISESAPDEIRGFLLGLIEFSIVWGICVSYAVGYASERVGHGWELVFQIESLPALAMGIGLGVLPKVEVSMSSQSSESITQRVKGVLLGKKAWMVYCGMGLALFQNVSGSAAASYYISVIFDATYSWSKSTLMLSLTGVGLVKVAGDLVSMLIIDLVGRKTLLNAGYSLCGVCCLAIAALYFVGDSDNNYIIYLLVCAFLGCYEIGPGTVTWVYLGELFDIDIKEEATALCLLTCFLTSYVMNSVFPVMKDALGLGLPFLVFGLGSLLAIVFVEYGVPEVSELQRDSTSASDQGKKSHEEQNPLVVSVDASLR